MASYFKHFAQSITGTFSGTNAGSGIGINANPLAGGVGIVNTLIYTCPSNRYAVAYLTSATIVGMNGQDSGAQIGLINGSDVSLFTRFRPAPTGGGTSPTVFTSTGSTPILILPGQQVYATSATMFNNVTPVPSCTYEILEFYAGTL